MMLKHLKIKNIRSYKEQEIDFSPGVLIFQGDIGSGKSSILYSVEFALFGATQQKFYDKLMRHGAKKASVELKFSIDGIDYTAFRSLKRKSDGIKGDESYLERENTKMELSWQEMRDRIVELLELREGSRGKVRTFHMSIYTPQEKMKEILSMNTDDRLEAIRKVFNLEDYKRAVDNISTVKKELEVEINTLETRAERLDDEKDRFAERKEELTEKKEDRETSKDDLQEAKKSVSELKERKKELEKLNEKIKETESEEKRIKDKIENLESNIQDLKEKLDEIVEGEKRLDEIEGKKKRYEELGEEIEEIRGKVEKRERLESEIEKLQVKLENKRERVKDKKESLEKKEELEEKVDELDDEVEVLDELKENRDDLRGRFSDLKGSMKSVESRIKILNDEKKDIMDLEDEAKCPKCKQPIDDEHIEKIIEDTDSQIDELRDEKEELKSEKKEVKDELDELQKEIREIEKKDKELDYTRKEIKRIEEETEDIDEIKSLIQGKEEEVEKLKDQVEEFEYERDDLKPLVKERNELRKFRDEYLRLKQKVKEKEDVIEKKKETEESFKELKKRRSELVDKLEDLKEGFSKDEFEEVKRKYDKCLSEKSTLEERVKNLKNDIERLNKEIEEKKEFIEELKHAKEEANKLKRLKNWLVGDFKESIKSMEEHRMAQLNRDFEQYFTNWFDNILEDPEISARLDEDFAPLITVQNNETSVDDLSGGERTSVALAYRLAFNTMIKKELGLKSNLLVLDEPTTGFSREQLTRLKDVMELLTADQVIIVSHENEIANLADVEYVVQKIDGISEVKKIG